MRWPSPTRTSKRRSATCGTTVASSRRSSDSENEQLDWRGQLGDVGRYTGKESEPDLSGGDTDDDCIAERVAAFEAHRERKARRERGPRDYRGERAKRKGSRPLGEVQRLWDAGMASSSHQSRDDDRENLTSATDMRVWRAEGASSDTSRSGDERTTTGEVATDGTFATRLTGRSARFGSDEDAGTGQPDGRRQQPAGERKERQSRVARVAAFARWAEVVTARLRTTRSHRRNAPASERGAPSAAGRRQQSMTPQRPVFGWRHPRQRQRRRAGARHR